MPTGKSVDLGSLELSNLLLHWDEPMVAMKHRLRFSLLSLILMMAVVGGITFANASTIRAVLSNWTAAELNVVANDQKNRWPSFDAMHEHYAQHFVSSEGFGISRIVDFNGPEFRLLDVDGESFAVQDMRLLGLRDDQPKVYLATWGGKLNRSMLEQNHYASRDLEPFEAESLERLRVGADMIWKMNDDGQVLTLVGALRASASCQSCHDAQPNELLGAFVYEMYRADFDFDVQRLNADRLKGTGQLQLDPEQHL